MTAVLTKYNYKQNGQVITAHPETESGQVIDFIQATIDIIENDIPVPADYYERPVLPTTNKTSVTIHKDTMYMLNGNLYIVNADTVVSIPASITASARAGTDLYLYAVENVNANGDTTPTFVISVNSTYPDGYNTVTSRKLGGFHCLCLNVGTIANHHLSGYLTGDIIPLSMWDLKHRPRCEPEGMVYDPYSDIWVAIYLGSVSGNDIVSVYQGVIADGASSPKFHWYKFQDWLRENKKRMPTQSEFMHFSLGSNQGTNIQGSADPNTTGGHVDTSGRRMISNIGCEDCCGVMWQWVEDLGYGVTSGSNPVVQYDSNDNYDVKGSSWYGEYRGRCGGFPRTNGTTECNGSRMVAFNNTTLDLHPEFSIRQVSEPLV